MGYNSAECAHMWVHNKRMKSDESRFYESSNMSFNENSAYSYRTVICQALDREKNLFLMIDESLTNQTSKHIGCISYAIPSDWNIIRTHWEGSSYDHVYFLGRGKKFDESHRIALMSHLLMDLYKQFKNVTTGRKASTENISLMPLYYIFMLNRLYNNGCSLKKWLRIPKGRLPGYNEFIVIDRQYRKEDVYGTVRTMVEKIIELNFYVTNIDYGRWRQDGVKCDDEDWKMKISDAMFGDGTWDAMKKRLQSIHNAKNTIEKMNSYRSYFCLASKKAFEANPEGFITNKELMKMLRTEDGRKWLLKNRKEKTAERERLEDEKRALMRKRNAINRARKFLGINTLAEWELQYSFTDRIKCIENNGAALYTEDYSRFLIINQYGLSADVWPHYIYTPYNNDVLGFGMNMYRSFCAAPDKVQWRKRFWQMAALCMRRKRGDMLYRLFLAVDGNMALTDEDTHIMNEFVVRKDRWEEDQEKKERIEMERKKKELQEKLEKLEAYKSGGIEGVRRIWREHLGSIPSDISGGRSELYYGGNVLLRFGSQDGIIETSKGIRMTFAECHKYWDIIKGWHEGAKFKPVHMAGYSVEYFKNDILKAGCHEIAYCEMERMYKETCEREAA